MATYVLVHGSWHGAWCWYKVVPRLEQAGHRVLVPDLPGHGRDKTPVFEVSLQSCVERVCEVIDSQPEPVILVAHSRGGIIISQVAEQRPPRIQKLVYLAAFLVPSGEALLPLALSDANSLILPNLEINREERWDMLRREAFRAALYADCSDEDVALAHLLLTPEPAAPAATPLQLSDEGFGSIPRFYIELLADRAVSPALQKRMYTGMPCQEVFSIDASHSAYFSKPDELAGRLLALAEGGE